MSVHKQNNSKKSHHSSHHKPQIPSQQSLTPTLYDMISDMHNNASYSTNQILNLQRLFGNQFVHQLTSSKNPTNSEQTVIQRLPAQTKWIDDSTFKVLGIKKPRSPLMQNVDFRLGSYHEADEDDIQKRYERIIKLLSAINKWRSEKSEADDRWQLINALRNQAFDEQDEIKAKLRETTKVERNTFINEHILPLNDSMPDNNARAKEVFRRYMDHFQGNIDYTLSTASDVTVWNGGGSVACATIAGGLADAMGRNDNSAANLDAHVVLVTPKDFLTKQITNDFIDTNAKGNVYQAGHENDFASTKRYFFNSHYVVRTGDGLIFDPTSGVELSNLNATEIVDTTFNRVDGIDGMYSNDNQEIRQTGQVNGGGAYELRDLA